MLTQRPRPVTASEIRARLQAVAVELERLQAECARLAEQVAEVEAALGEGGLDNRRPPVSDPSHAPLDGQPAALVPPALRRGGIALRLPEPPRGLYASRVLPSWLVGLFALEGMLFVGAILVYAATRLWALDQFPIYFFADEAIQVLLGEDVVGRGLRNASGDWFPIYLPREGLRWLPLLTIYFHGFPALVFGKSIVVARAIPAILSVISAGAIALMLREVFKVRSWWAVVLFLAITPAWFIHSRTAFETAIMVSTLAIFLLFYLLYRCRSPRYIYLALVSGAVTFYSYSNGQTVMTALGLMLLVADIRYHLRNWRILATTLPLALVLALPFIGFRLNHPSSMLDHLRAIDSYWFYPIPVQEKLARFATTYLYALSPQYWFFPNDELQRHRWVASGHIREEVLPLVALGALLCVWRIRSAPFRVVLLTALATPAGAALAGIGITRVLSFVVPAAIFASLGLDFALRRVSPRIPYPAAAGASFCLLSLGALLMLRQAIVDGPFWFRSYGLYGMQWGARQLFVDTIPEFLDKHPDVQLELTPTWANATNDFIPFFLTPEQQTRVVMNNIDSYLEKKGDLSDRVVLIMTDEEYKRALASRKFERVEVEQLLPYPDGTPGFYFVRLAYVANIDQVLAAERAARQRPVQEQIEIDGQLVRVQHPIFDAGGLKDMLDGDRFTLARVMEANPAILDFEFPTPRRVSGISGDFGSMDFSLTVDLYEPGSNSPRTYRQIYKNLPPDPHVEMSLDSAPGSVQRVRVTIEDTEAPPDTDVHIHIRDIQFQP